jgi:hypothetical protein
MRSSSGLSASWRRTIGEASLSERSSLAVSLALDPVSCGAQESQDKYWYFPDFPFDPGAESCFPLGNLPAFNQLILTLPLFDED